MLDRTDERDALRALANAIISWRHHHAHNVPGFGEIDKCLRRVDDILRKAGYFGDAARDADEEDATGIDI